MIHNDGIVGIGKHPTEKFDVNGMVRSSDLRIDNGNIHLGQNAGLSQGANSIAIGYSAGQTTQGIRSIAIGDYAGSSSQGHNSIAIGRLATTGIGGNSIAIGHGASCTGTAGIGGNSIAIGTGATTSTGGNSIAIGLSATTSTFGNSVAIGAGASCDAVNQITLGTVLETVRILGTLNFSKRPQTWYIISNTSANATTGSAKNIGGSTQNTPTTAYWNIVTVFGGANSSNWNTTTAVFTASQSGLYQFQLSLFINTPSTIGRWLSAGGTCIPSGQTTTGTTVGKFQYLSWGQSYLGVEGSLSVSCSYYMSAGETFFWYAEVQTPSIFYGEGHSYSQIIKVY